MISILFWAAVLLVAYSCVLFPLFVVVRGILISRPYKSAEITPKVSMIVAAHNEARVMRAKLENSILLDYPSGLFELLVVSDGSDDGTDAIVLQYSDLGVNLLSLPRQGKARALNSAVAATTGEILIFSDANSLYERGAIRALVQPFADSEVGGVVGNQCYLPNSKSLTSDGEKSYWNLDRKLKLFESKAGNAISATGAIYAIRRALFRVIPPGVTDDFFTSTGVIAQGYRLVFAPDAVAYEPVAESGRKEFGRKIRVITRGLHAVLVMRQLLNPMRYGFYAIQLLSHKVVRRLLVFPLLALFFLNPLLWAEGFSYQAVALIQIGFYGFATLGILLERAGLTRLKVFTIPLFFCIVNLASFCAILNVLRGHQIDRWEPHHERQI